MTSLTSLLDAARRRLPGHASPDREGRRRFFKRSGALGAAAVGGSLLVPDEAWAAVEERASRFGITPGAVVDEVGRPMTSQGTNPYLGEISLVGWNFPARGWALCEGQLLAIAQYTALFSLLGTTFGGDGRTTFGLPDLRGRGIVGVGNGPGLTPTTWGQRGGVESVTLTTPQLPSHTHSQPVSDAAGNNRAPNGLAPAIDASGNRNFTPDAGGGAQLVPMNAAGGSQSHENRPPLLAMNYQIALQGVFPSRS